MKVFDLSCQHDHRFEGWFASDTDFEEQKTKGVLTCPMCDSAQVFKVPSATRLNLGHGVAPSSASAETPHAARTSEEVPVTTNQSLESAWMQVVRHVVASTEDVGKQFAAEARKMHYGEVPERPIRGHATPQDTQALQEEGIEVFQMPLPAFAKETLQ